MVGGYCLLHRALVGVGARGFLFAVGLIVGLYVGTIFHLWGKLHFLQDSSCPDFVTAWINTIIPNLITLGIAMVLVNVLKLDVYSLVIAAFMPLANIGQTLPGFILICLIPAFFYTLGISSWTFGAVTTPIYMPNARVLCCASHPRRVAQE